MGTDEPAVLASCNRKGGVGKTSLVFHLAGELACRGQRVLTIDVDPQASLSQSFFGPEAIEQLPDEAGAVALFDDQLGGAPEDVIHATEFENLWAVPASDALARYALPQPEQCGPVEEALLQLVHEVRGEFDVVLIDTPPNVLQLLSWAACVAADGVLTPLIPEEYASQGLVGVKRFIEQVRNGRNPELRWFGLVLQMVQPRLAVHQSYEEQLRETYGDLVFTQKIPQVVAYKEAVSMRKPVTIYKPRIAASKAIKALADELLLRLEPTSQRSAA